MLIKSIRFRLVLWYMLILSITLFVLGVALYQNFNHKLKHDMDDLLRSRAKGITDSINTYWEAERLSTDKNAPVHVFDKQGNINFVRIAQRWVNEKTMDPALIDFSVDIFDTYGEPVASSKDIATSVIPKDISADVFQVKSHFEDRKIELSPGKAVVFRTFTTPVIENGKVSYIVQVASPLTAMKTALHNLVLLLFLLLPLTVILTGIAGAFLAKIALDPVHQMIETIHQITAENLKLRIEIPTSKDEIQDLALTFNEMIVRLDDAFSSQRQFMEDISHELKTPLSVLKGELEVTLKKVRSAAEYETTLSSNLEEVNRLARIVENLLTLARFDTKTIALEPEAFDLNGLIKSALEDIRVLAEQKTIVLEFNPEEPIVLNADRSQVRRLLLNLLDNAVKYSLDHGRVLIRTRSEGGFFCMDIANNGIGIPVDELPRIFDRFYRVEKSRGRSGFGLGLSIVKSIAEAHKGKVAVSSSTEGTVFTVSFPAKSN